MRRLIAFPCEGETLAATLDDASGSTGLLIVSGGNEIRVGAHRGMALLAARVAAAGHPVFRFDRRGVGDSTGENRGYRSGAADIAGAAATFRAETKITRLVGFGNCDAASALALFGRDAGLDAVILANPWVVEPVDDLPSPAAIRARYAQKLRSPAALLRLVTGKVNLRRLARGLLRIGRRAGSASDTLTAIASWDRQALVLLATGDATALAFQDAAGGAARTETIRIDTASHSFADTGERLTGILIDRLSNPR